MFFLVDTRGREVGGLGFIYNYSYCFEGSGFGFGNPKERGRKS